MQVNTMERILNMISKHALIILLLSFIAYNTNSFAQEGNKGKNQISKKKLL